TPGKQGTPMRRVAADGGPPSANGYGGPIRRLMLTPPLGGLVSLAAIDVHAQNGDLNFTRPAAPPPAHTPTEKEGEKDDKKQPRLFAFAMDGKPWKEVFKWLMDNTKKPVIAQAIPTGTLTLLNPTERKYNLGEVIDIINEALLANSATQKYYLIQRERNFILVPADEKIDPALVPQITPEELMSPERGNTELVQVLFPLKNQSAAN